MPELNPAPWLQNSGATNTAQLMRLGVGSFSAGSTSGVIPRGGVHPSLGGLLSVTAGGGLSVNVGSGVIYIPGTSDSVAQGLYVCVNTSTVNKVLQAADGSNPRIDLVVARVRDSFYDAGVDNDWFIDVVTGTPSGAPVVPTPTFENFLALAEVAVPASATVPGTITDVRLLLSAVGGILPLRDDEIAPTTGVYEGMYADQDGVLIRRTGSSWLSVASPTTPTRQTITATGTYTAPAGLRYAFARIAAGGGSAGGCASTGAGQGAESGGGGGGETREIWYTAAQIGATAPVTIGAGGAATASGENNGNSGGTTTFNPAGTGATLTANGGGGGEGSSAASVNSTLFNGAGGSGGSGGLGIPGGDGGCGRLVEGSVTHGNFGGASALSNTSSVPDANSAGRAGNLYGGGASGGNSGASQSARAGQAGATGVVIVDEYY